VIAIKVVNVGKKFKLFTSPGRRFLEYLSMGKISGHIDFWALRDISFEIPKGTTLGILGQNGSGKSTLLSILAGVLYPTAGSFEIQGKVSAILELGSGFHPEFSGRDNVYMYGSIMGLSRHDVEDRFDKIVQFSELGDFIDQPLRTYSSGMIVRLAFSVAVHVDAEILIVDEALAVGDAIFQHRCFRKIREMQSEGKTILYVGHDTEAVRNLCTSALLLDGGRIVERGDPNTVVNKYLALITERERTYSEGNLIEHGSVPGEECETVFDFVRNLHDAKIESAKGISVQQQTVEIHSKPRLVIFAHPPSKITYSVLIGPESSLAFAIGILPEAWDKILQGVKFDIEIYSDGIKENIFSRVLQPKRNIGDRGWHNFIIPLRSFAGENVNIVFTTTASTDDLSYCWAAWGWGKIIVPTKSTDSPSAFFKEILINIADENEELDLLKDKLSDGNKKVTITAVDILDSRDLKKMLFESGDNLTIRIHVFFNQDVESGLAIGFVLKGKYCDIFGINNLMKHVRIPAKKKGDSITVEYSTRINLTPGLYSINVGCMIVHPENEIELLDRRFDCAYIKVSSDKKMVGIVDLETKINVIE
jgi:ABC-type polysaccharide/polyol phosphate transport system ATPase subunit